MNESSFHFFLSFFPPLLVAQLCPTSVLIVHKRLQCYVLLQVQRRRRAFCAFQSYYLLRVLSLRTPASSTSGGVDTLYLFFLKKGAYRRGPISHLKLGFAVTKVTCVGRSGCPNNTIHKKKKFCTSLVPTSGVPHTGGREGVRPLPPYYTRI